MDLLAFLFWFVWRLPAAIFDDYVVIRRVGAPRVWSFRMACWVNLDAGWAALTARPIDTRRRP